MLYDSLILYMTLVGLSVISIFNCKSNYRSHVLKQTMEKTMDNACWTMNYCSLCVDLHFLYIHFMHSLAHAVRLQIAILATRTKLHGKLLMLLCCVVSHKLSMCNFKSFTCYMVCIN